MMLALCVLLPAIAAIPVWRLRNREHARGVAAVVASVIVALALVLSRTSGESLGVLELDSVSALLLPFVALMCWMLVLAAPTSWARPAALARLLLNESVLLCAFAVSDVRLLVVLWALSYGPVLHALATDDANRPVFRAFLLYAAASTAAFTTGTLLLASQPLTQHWSIFSWTTDARPRAIGVALVVVAVLIRKATLPFHSWLPAVFDVRPTGPTLLLIAPMLGAYSLVRVALPLVPEVLGERLFLLGPLSLVTAVYAAGLALVQTDLRRLVAWLAMSQSALVLVGLECPHGDGLAGGIVTWLSAGMALTGLALTAWLIESRHGRLSLDHHHGLYRRSPLLGLIFLLSGLSLVGFPGMAGFVGNDLLLRAVLRAFPSAGLLMFAASALSGIAILSAFFRVFYGPPERGRVIDLLPRERAALFVPLALMVWQGIQPAPLVNAGAHAAQTILAQTRPHGSRAASTHH
ncbi:MAG: proton-conducting transporter membrane subunit [Polyangiaceae bacterium]